MKNLFFALFSLLFLVSACKKDEIATSTTPVEIATTDKVLFSGAFVSGAHTTSGDVKIIQSTDAKKYLILENLKTDAGPDIRIYIAEDKTTKGFTEITNKVVNGNSKLELPATVNTDKQKSVLIWCKQFSVLFGSADLK